MSPMKPQLCSFLIAAILWIGLPMNAQIISSDELDGDQIYMKVDQKPQFPGGKESLERFLNKNLRYPITLKEQHIRGRVICQFVVNTNGSISDIEVVRSNNPAFNVEALRVIELMPRWEPGLLNDQPVRVLYTLPINFDVP